MNQLKCPACEKPLSFLNVAKAPTPFHLTCDHCHTKLRFEKHGVAALVLVLLLGLLAGGATLLLGGGYVDVIATMILAGIIFEVIYFILASKMNFRLIVRGATNGV
jgi:uncharacterized membrane protein YjjP (DUF1212 family)